MAFNSNASASRNNNAGANSQNDSWKAQGFLNLYLPSKNGKRSKLGAIALHDSRTSEAEMRAWLEEDPTRVEQILAKLIIEYRSSEPTEGSGFDLS